MIMKTRKWPASRNSSRHRSHDGFSRTELFAVLAVLTFLALALGSSLARSREPGQRVGCINNLRQLGIALLIYSSENDNLFPPRGVRRWTTDLQRYYGDLSILRCPNDGANPATFGGTNSADRAPRSYLFNRWSDYFSFNPPESAGFPESAIQYPTATILFGEKVTESGFFWYNPVPYDDLDPAEKSRHLRSSPSNPTSGGSNYAMADGNVSFLKYGRSLSPINLWSVIDDYRTNSFFIP